MLLVIDANVVFAALLNPSGMNGELLFSTKIKLISPEFLEEEFKKYIPLIASKSGRSEADIKISFDLVLSRIEILPKSEYQKYHQQAEQLAPDQNDVEYFAVALAFDCPLWSNDKLLKKQKRARVFSTADLLMFFK